MSSSRTPSQQTVTALSVQNNNSFGVTPVLPSDAMPTHSVEGTVRAMEMATERTAWTAEQDGCIRVRGLPSGVVVKTLDRKNKNTFCNALLLVEGKVWAAYSDGFLRRYDAKTATLEREVVQHDGAVYALHATAGRVFSGGADWKLYQWSPSSCEYQRQFYGHTNSVRCLCSYTTANGPVLFSGSDDTTIRAWDPHAPLQSNKDIACIATLKGHTKAVLVLETVAERRQLWSGGEDHSIRVWSMETFQCVATLERHKAPVAALAFVETRVWSGGKDGTLFLWDAKTHTPLQTLQEGIQVSAKYVMCIKKLYRAHYCKLWTSTSDGFIQCWNADASGSVEGFEFLSVEDAVARKRDNARIEGLQAALYEHGAMLNAKEDEIKELQHRIAVLKDPTQNPDLVGLSDRCELLTNDLEDILRQREQMSARCAMADDLLHTTRQKLKESELKRKEADESAQHLRAELTEANKKLLDMHALHAENDRLRMEQDELKQVILRQEGEAAELQGTMKRLEDAVRTHQSIYADNARLRREVETLESSLGSERKVVESLRQEAARLALAAAATGSAKPHTSPSASSRAASLSAGRTPSGSRHAGRAGSGRRMHGSSPLAASQRRHELDTSDEDERLEEILEEASRRSQAPEDSLLPTTTSEDEHPPAPRALVPLSHTSPVSSHRSGSKGHVPASLDVPALEERLENLRIENDSLSQRAAALRSDMEQAAASEAQAKLNLDKLKQESSKTIGELRASLKVCQSELASKTAQLESAVSEASAASDAQRKELSKKEKQLIDLRDALAKSKDAAERIARDAEQRSASDAQERELLKRQVADARREKERVDKQLAEKEIQAQKQPQQPPLTEAVASPGAAELRQKLVQTQRQLEESEKEVRALKVIESRATAEIAVLREDVEKLASGRVAPVAAQQQQQRQSSQRSLNASLDNNSNSGVDSPNAPRMKAEIVAATDDDGAQRSPILVRAASSGSPEKLLSRRGPAGSSADVAVALVQLRRENDDLQREKSHLTSAIQQLVQDMESESAALSATKSQLSMVVAQREEEREAMREALEFIESERDKAAELQNAISLLTDNVSRADAEKQSLSATIVQLQRKIDEDIQTMEKLRGEVQILQDREASALSEQARYVAELQERLASAGRLQREAERDTQIRLKVDRDAFEAERQALTSRNETLTSQLAEATMALAELRRAYDERRDRVPSPTQCQTPRRHEGEDGDTFHTPQDATAFQQVIDELEEALSEKARLLEESENERHSLAEKLETVAQDLAECIAQRRTAEDNYAVASASLEKHRSDLVALQKDHVEASEALKRSEKEASMAKASLASLQETLESMRMSSTATIKSLAQRYDAERLEKEALEGQLQASLATNHMLEGQVRQLTQQCAEAADDVTNMTTTVKHLQTLRADLTAENAQLKAELSTKSGEYFRAVSDLTQAKCSVAQDLDRAQADVGRLTNSLEMRTRQLQALEAEVSASRSEADSERLKLLAVETASQQRVVELEAELTATRGQLKNITDELASTTKSAEKAARQQATQLDTLRETLETTRKVAESAQAELEQVKAARRQLELHTEESDRTIALLRSDFSRAKADADQMRQELMKTLSERQDATTMLSEASRAHARDMERVEDQAQRAQSLLLLKERQYESLENDASILRAELDTMRHRLEAEVAASEKKRTEAARSAESQTTAVAHLEGVVNGLQQEVLALKQQVARETEAHQLVASLLQDTHATVASQAQSLMSLSGDCDRAQREASELRSVIARREAEVERLSAELESARQAQDDTNQAHSQLCLQVYDQRQVIEAQTAQLEALSGADERAKALTETAEATRVDLQHMTHRAVEAEDSLAKTQEQLHHATVYTAELEATLTVLKQSLQDRKSELCTKQADLEALEERLHEMEQSEARLRHRAAEADRDHSELLRLRELTMDQGGVVDAATQENRILVDQLAASEELCAAMEAKVEELEGRLTALAGSSDVIQTLTASRDMLQEDLARTQQALLKKTEEAIVGCAAQDRADYLQAKLEATLAEADAEKHSFAATEAQLKEALRLQEERLLLSSREVELYVRDLTAAQRRIGDLGAEVAQLQEAADQLQHLRRDRAQCVEEVGRLQAEVAALQKRLAATGPLSQLEMEMTAAQWERTTQSQRELIRNQESTISQLQQAIQADQAVLSLVLSEVRIPRDKEQWARELAEAKSKAQNMESVMQLQHQSLAASEQQVVELRNRLRLAEGLLMRSGGVGGSTFVDSNTPSGSRAPSLLAQRRNEGGLLHTEEDVSCIPNMTADDMDTEPVVLSQPCGGNDEDHLVPTPQPTPRLHLSAPHAASSAVSFAQSNPVMVRTYVEYLASTVQRQTDLVDQLARATLQRAEGQRLLAERLGSIRSLMLSNGAKDTGALAVLVDEATSYRASQLESIVAAQRSRLDSVSMQLLQAREQAALDTAHRSTLHDEGAQDALVALEDILQRKTSALLEMSRDRDQARSDAAKKSRTVAVLVEYFRQQTAGGGVSPLEEKSLELAKQCISAASLERTNAELRAEIRRLHTTIATLETVPQDGSKRDSDAVSELLEAKAEAEERARLAEDGAVSQAVELVELQLALASLRNDIQNVYAQLEQKTEGLEQANATTEATRDALNAATQRISAQSADIADLTEALHARDKRKAELVAWVRSTSELNDSLGSLTDAETYDSLVVCKHMLRLLRNAQEEVRAHINDPAKSEQQRLLLEAQASCAFANSRVEQLLSDVRTALDDAAKWHKLHEEGVASRDAAVRRAAAAEAEMIALKASLETEQATSAQLRQTTSQLVAAARTKEGVIEMLQQRLSGCEHRVQELSTEVELRDADATLKTGVIQSLQRDIQFLKEMEQQREAAESEATGARRELEHKVAALMQDEADLRSHCQLLEAKTQAAEGQYEAEVRLSETLRQRLEMQLGQLKKENESLSEQLSHLSAAQGRIESLERDVASMAKRLALSQELSHQLREQNTVLERHRVETVNLRSKLGTTAADVVHLRRLCVDSFGILPIDAEERSVTAYLVLLEEQADKYREERAALKDIQGTLEALYADLVAARQASHHIGATQEEDGHRASLSLSPSLHSIGPDGDGGSRSASTRSVSPSANVTALQQVSDVKPWLEKIRVATKSLSIQQWSLLDTIRSQRGKMLHLADHNKALSEEIDALSNRLKSAASKMLRNENSEQLLTFLEPSRDIAVRTLFHMRDHINDIKIRLTLLHGTVSQTKEHWVELYRQAMGELDPVTAHVQQAQGLLSYAFDRCLTAQEKDELMQDSSLGSSQPPAPHYNTPQPEPMHQQQTPRGAAGPQLHKTPQQQSTSLSSAIIGLGGESAANRDVVARGIVEARRREAQRSDRDR